MRKLFTHFSARIGRSTALLMMLLLPLLGWGQTTIAYWNFNTPTSASSPRWAATLPADVGAGTLTHNITTALEAFAGTTVNAEPSVANGSSFSPQVGSSNVNNGKVITLSISTVSYNDPVLTYATQTSGSTGFTTQAISYSTDGTNYTAFGTVNPVPNSFAIQTFDFSAIALADNNANFKVRITLSGGSGSTGNNRIDNIKLSGTSGTPPVVVLPTVTTDAATAIAATTATAGGNVTSDGNGTLTARGVVYGTATNPTTAGPTVVATGTSTGAFSVSLTGLTASTLYCARAYATNSAGTAYGPEVTFTTAAPTPNPVPTIGSLSPATVVAGAAAQTLNINGTNFLSSSVVSFNGNTRTTTFVSATQLRITLTAADQATPGSYDVTVTNPTPGGGTTAPATFTVTAPVPNPVPTISSLAPTTAVAGSGAFTLIVNGSNFVSGSTVTFNNVNRAVTYVSATRLDVAVLATDIATAGTYDVVVTNAAPGGGASAPATFTVTPAPVSATLLLYTFNSRVVTPDASSNPNVSGDDFAVGPGISRNSTTNAYVTSNYTTGVPSTRQASDWLSFSIIPNAAFQVSLSALAFDDQVSTGTGKVDVLYSLNSDFSGAVMVGAVQNAGTSIATHTINLSGIAALQNVAQPIYFRLYPYAIANGSATYRVDNVKLDGGLTPAPALVFYAKPTGDLNVLATFGTNADGTGTAPTSFGVGNSTYNITGTGRTISAAWTVSGASKAVLATGASFTIPAAFNYTGTLDLAGTAYLTVLNTSPTVTLGSLSASSTVEYAQASGTFTVPAVTNGYGNLTLSNASKRLSSASQGIDVYGNLTLQNVTNVGGASTSSFTIVTLLGNLNMLGTSTFDQTSSRKITIVLAGIPTQPQVLAGNGNTIRLFRLDVQNSASLSDANGGTLLELGNSSSNGGGFDIASGQTLTLNANTLSFVAGGNATIGTGTGTLTLSPTSSLNLESVDNFVGTLRPTPNATTLLNLRVATTAGDYLDVTQSLTVNGALALDGGIYDIGANQSLTLNGTLTGTGSIRGSSTSDLLIGGTGALGTLRFTLGTAAGGGTTQQLRNLTLNRASGTLALGTILALNGTLTLTEGILTTTTANGLTLATAATVSGGSAASFVSGPLARVVPVTSSSASYPFPLGKGAAYRPLTLRVNSQTNAITYRAEQVEGDPGQLGTVPTATDGTTLTRVSRIRSFTITPLDNNGAVTQPTGFQGQVTLSFDTDDRVTNAINLEVAKRADSTQPWANISLSGGAINGTTGGYQTGSVTSGTFSTFSDFALASTELSTTNNPLANSAPLPVELSAFTAQRQASQAVSVRWTTASEKNSDRFEVQRSLNGRDFVTVATEQAQGTSTKATSYAIQDHDAPAAQLYYRLRQIDRDGTVAYSPVATVAGLGTTAKVLLNPNPAHSSISFLAEAATPYRVLNQLGQAVLHGTTETGTANVSIEQLPTGLYFLELQTAAGRTVQKFEKH